MDTFDNFDEDAAPQLETDYVWRSRHSTERVRNYV